MFRTLRNRLIFIQVIPMLVILPLMGGALVYTLERQFLIPQLAKNLLGDARMMAEISGTELELWGNPVLFRNMVRRVQLDPDITVMFLPGEIGTFNRGILTPRSVVARSSIPSRS